MEWSGFIIFPIFTIGAIALGLVIHTIKQIKKLEERVKELENKSQ
ncbi:hypothetical protein [Peribacillus butanolivorans]